MLAILGYFKSNQLFIAKEILALKREPNVFDNVLSDSIMWAFKLTIADAETDLACVSIVILVLICR